MFEYNTTKNTITDEQTGSKWAKVCEDCAMECEKHDMDHCQQRKYAVSVQKYVKKRRETRSCKPIICPFVG